MLNGKYLVLVAIILLVSPVLAVSSIENLSISGGSAYLNCSADDVSADDIWVNIRINGNDGWVYSTDNSTSALDNRSFLVDGSPLYSHTAYEFVCYNTTSNGTIIDFTMPDAVVITTNTYAQRATDLRSTKGNFTQFAIELTEPYTDVMGKWVWGIGFAVIYAVLFISTGTVLTPSIVHLLIALPIIRYHLLPAPVLDVVWLFMWLSIGGILYYIIMRRRA